jgi:hypothetical protein
MARRFQPFMTVAATVTSAISFVSEVPLDFDVHRVGHMVVGDERHGLGPCQLTAHLPCGRHPQMLGGIGAPRPPTLGPCQQFARCGAPAVGAGHGSLKTDVRGRECVRLT